MAKLSLKGIVSLSHQIIKDGKTNIHNIELFQDDFEDCVMLSVEEAKNVEACVGYCFDCTSETHFRFMHDIARLHLRLLTKRIEMATTPKDVRLSVEMAEDLNSAINHLFGLVKLNQVKLTQGEAIALRTFDDLVDRATSQFNQVVKKVIEQAEKQDE